MTPAIMTERNKMKCAIRSLSVSIGAALLLAAPAAWAKDPEPGATRKLEMLRDARDAEPRKPAGLPTLPPFGCVSHKEILDYYWEDGLCIEIAWCRMAYTDRKPCKYHGSLCESVVWDAFCGKPRAKLRTVDGGDAGLARASWRR